MAPVLLLFGPTASGKSALALALAEALYGEIINADSRQVYAHLPVSTAAPTAAEAARVPHHLYGYADPACVVSAGQWAAAAHACIAEVCARGLVPIVVGGTGFYLKVLADGIGAVPTVPPEVSTALSAWPLPELQQAVQAADPVLWQRIVFKQETGNRQRLVRALAVAQHSGIPLSVWQAQPGQGGLSQPYLKLALNPAKMVLETRIRQRWQPILPDILSELQAVLDRGYTLNAPGLQALAARPFIAHLQGQASLSEALEALVASDLAYTKRQRTWLRTQYRADAVFDGPEAAPVLAWLAGQGLHPRTC